MKEIATQTERIQANLWEQGESGDAAEKDKRSDGLLENEKSGRTEGSWFKKGFSELSEVNPDLRGWITIPGTELSFPVVQGADNIFYLNHDFYGQSDRHGTIFADCEADFNWSANMILYGHNMRDGSMFGSLKKYGQENYYREHPSFYIATGEEEREYEIISVFINDIYSRADEPFQYYDYACIKDREMFTEYYDNIKKRSLYDTGVEAVYTDRLVTLCTCDYGGRDQRLLIVGKLRQ